jgi:tRNA 2-thiouridine synthesizing protein A
MSNQLNARNLLCPMPVIRTQDQIAEMKAGDILEVISTDPGVKNDIPAWCRINGHKVISITDDDRDIIITIEVGEEVT